MKLGKVEMHYLEGRSQVLLSGISITNLEVLRGFQSHTQECSRNQCSAMDRWCILKSDYLSFSLKYILKAYVSLINYLRHQSSEI